VLIGIENFNFLFIQIVDYQCVFNIFGQFTNTDEILAIY